jgi:hypothetical protein
MLTNNIPTTTHWFLVFCLLNVVDYLTTYKLVQIYGPGVEINQILQFLIIHCSIHSILVVKVVVLMLLYNLICSRIVSLFALKLCCYCMAVVVLINSYGLVFP